MDLRQLRYFVTLAEELHFGRAAARLNVVQPAISQQIKNLEDDIGLRLVDRSSRKVVLTDAGAAFLSEARQVLLHMDLARRAAHDASKGVSGFLNIGFVDNAIWSIFPEVIRDFRISFPKVEIRLTQMARGDQIEAVESGELDVGVIPAHGGLGKFFVQPLAESALDVVLPEVHPLSTLEKIDVSALESEHFISFSVHNDPKKINELIEEMCLSAGFNAKFGQAVQQMHTALALVSTGLGVAIVPRWMRRAWRDSVVYVPLNTSTTYKLVLVSHILRHRQIVEHFTETAARVAAIAGGAQAVDC